MPTDEETLALLRRIPLFAALDEQELQRFAQTTHGHAFKRGEILFQKGDPAEGFFFLVAGQVKLVLLAADGHEKVVELIQPGMSFGEAVMLIGRPYPAYAEALGAGRALYIPRAGLIEAVRSNPDFSLRLLAGLSARMHALVREIEELSTQNALQRVVGYLVGERVEQAADAVDLPASKAVIASRLNLTPETFSRVLHTLQERALIRVSGRRIELLDVAGLRACNG